MTLAAFLGLLPWGSAFGWFAAWMNRRQEMDLRRLEHSQACELVRLRNEGALQEGELAAFTASQHAAAAEDGAGVWRWVKSLRYGTRAGLTWLLCLAAVVLAWRAGSASDLSGRVVVFAEIALGWWFGSRPNATRPSK